MSVDTNRVSVPTSFLSFVHITLTPVLEVHTSFTAAIREHIILLFSIMAYSNGFWGTAVCAFSLSSVDAVFDRGPFKAQQTFGAGWQQVPENEVPVPRPGQVQVMNAHEL